MNSIQIMGYLGADAETRFTPNGQKVTNLRIATTVRRGGTEKTVWYRVTLWGDRFDKMLPYLKKGTALIVVGELGEPTIYADKEGRNQISLEVTAEFIRFSPFGKGEKSSEGRQNEQAPGKFAEARAAAPVESYASNDLDDGLPF